MDRWKGLRSYTPIYSLCTKEHTKTQLLFFFQIYYYELISKLNVHTQAVTTLLIVGALQTHRR